MTKFRISGRGQPAKTGEQTYGGGNSNGGSGTSGQGNNGGTTIQANGQDTEYEDGSAETDERKHGGSGGGGKGAVGGNGTATGVAGAGGSGSASSITGSSVTYATGGSGSNDIGAYHWQRNDTYDIDFVTDDETLTYDKMLEQHEEA